MKRRYTLYKYQKATIIPTKRLYRDGFLLREWYNIHLGKQKVGHGPRKECCALKNELNRSRSKRILLSRHERRNQS